MSLRWKLLLVSLTLLVLPWSGWRLLQSMESQLRAGQAETLAASTDAVARALVRLRGALPPEGPRWTVQRLARTPRVDGRADDWSGVLLEPLGDADEAFSVRAALAGTLDETYLLVSVRDTTPVRADAHWPGAPSADHVQLGLHGTNGSHVLRIANAGDGDLRIMSADGEPSPFRLVGHWRDNDDGYSVELMLPRGWPTARVGLLVQDGRSAAPPRSVRTSTETGQTDWPLWAIQDRVGERLRSLIPEGVRARLVDDRGWVYADEGQLPAPDEDERMPWWKRQLWVALAHADAPLSREAGLGDRLDDPAFQSPRGEAGMRRWQRDPRAPRLLLSVFRPLDVERPGRASLWLQSEQQSLLHADEALTGLLGTTLVALAVVVLALLLFASRLSARIRRLRDAVDGALGREGDVHAFAPIGDRDEIGDLSRSFSRLLQEVSAHQAYLRSLAGKLSHELNTPIAVVRGALDNLDARGLPEEDRAGLERARAGGDRLAHIVRSMSEASRIEQAIAQADAEDFDLAALLRQCQPGYAQLLAPRRLELDVGTAPVDLHGSPELVVQALDKLIDNARGFTPEEGWVRISLARGVDALHLAVANSGSRLPESIRTRLFESLVSDGGGRRSTGVHLGLGLHVVRLVAELHGGRADAGDLPGGEGVEFVLRLRGMPRRGGGHRR